MSEFCKFRVENGITIVRFHARPDLDAIRDTMEELAANYPQKLRLWDLRQIVINQTREELLTVAGHSSETFSTPGRTAFVADDDLTYGVLRMFEVYNDQEPAQSQTRIFRDMDAAKQWLLND